MERGLMFKPEMIRALLEGRKVSTMRLIAKHNSIEGFNARWPLKPELFFRADHRLDTDCLSRGTNDYLHIFPRFQIGDRIYAKETWCLLAGDDESGDIILYRANKDDADEMGNLKNLGAAVKWHSAMFLPRNLARIWTPPITAILARRPIDLTEAEAVGEGFKDKADYIRGIKEIDGDDCLTKWFWMYRWDNQPEPVCTACPEFVRCGDNPNPVTCQKNKEVK